MRIGAANGVGGIVGAVNGKGGRTVNVTPSKCGIFRETGRVYGTVHRAVRLISHIAMKTHGTVVHTVLVYGKSGIQFWSGQYTERHMERCGECDIQ